MFTAIYESTLSIYCSGFSSLRVLHSGVATEFMKGKLVLNIDRDHTIIITLLQIAPIWDWYLLVQTVLCSLH